MKITQEVRDFAAKQIPTATLLLAQTPFALSLSKGARVLQQAQHERN